MLVEVEMVGVRTEVDVVSTLEDAVACEVDDQEIIPGVDFRLPKKRVDPAKLQKRATKTPTKSASSTFTSSRLSPRLRSLKAVPLTKTRRSALRSSRPSAASSMQASATWLTRITTWMCARRRTSLPVTQSRTATSSRFLSTDLCSSASHM